VIDLLKKLEQLAGKQVYELFDYFCGVSAGAIIVAAYGMYTLIYTILPKVFHLSLSV
jgi:hypothetical protein